MSSLKEHLEMQELPGTMEAPKGTKQQQQQQSQTRGVHVPRRVVVVGGIAMVAVVATAAVLSLTLSGSPDPPAAAPVKYQDSRRAPRHQPLSPLGLGPTGDNNDLFHRIAEHARLVIEERQKKQKEAAGRKHQSVHKQSDDKPHAQFEKVEVALENTQEHDSGPPVRSDPTTPRQAQPHLDFEVEVDLRNPQDHESGPPARLGPATPQRQVQPHPDFEEVEVELENTQEHDSGLPVSSGPSTSQRQVQPHPDFEEEVVVLERHVEHDAGPRESWDEDLQEKVAEKPESEEPETKPLQTDTKKMHMKEVVMKNAGSKKSGKKESEAEAKKMLTKDAKSEESKEGGLQKSNLLDEEEGKKEREAKKGVMMPKESTRLPTKRLANGNRVCETPECAEAAARIVESVDFSADPCQDFYQFACGGWIDNHPVPESGVTSTINEAVEIMDKRLHLILETPADPGAPSPLHMLRTFYDSCKDTDTLDALGLDPLVALLSSAQGGWPMVLDDWVPNTFTLTTALNNLRDLNVYPLVAAGVDLDIDNTSTRIIYVDAGTVPMGVSLMENPGQGLLGPYATFMTSAAKILRDHMTSTVTDQEIEQQVREIISFEITFARLVMKAVNETTDHAWRTTVTGLQDDTDAGTPGQFNWLAFLKEMFIHTGVTITTDEPLISFKGPFFSDFSELLAATDPRTLANVIGWWWVFELQQETTYAMRNISFDFLQAITGQTTISPRWVHCMDETNGNLGFALSREYVDQYMTDTVKPEVTELVEDLRESFSSLLDNNTWMLPQDLIMAEEKLAAVDTFVAYPDWIMDDSQLTLAYEGLNLVSGDHVGNLHKIGIWFDINSLASLREKPEHSFLYPPTFVNAFYSPQQNSITILGGILVFPFYSQNSLAALNYGSIGMIIGHEMTHGFDNTGRLFDKNGNLEQWWSDETISAYNQRVVCFVNQYNDFYPPELVDVGLNISVSGLQTLGENIADNGGVREAYHAYQLYMEHYGEEPRLPGLDEFSPSHLFYLGFANTWCAHNSAKATMTQLALDSHSPGRYRVLGPLSNDPEFSRVWNCPVGSPMNNGPNRCLLW